MNSADSAAAAETTPGAWISDLVFENLGTSDGRWIVQGALSWRELPLTLMAMTVNSEGGHVGSFVAGRIDSIGKVTDADVDGRALNQGVIAVRGNGVFDLNGVNGAEVARLVKDRMMRGVSVDLAVEEIGLRDPETGEVTAAADVTEDQIWSYFMGEMQLAFLKASVIAATVCPMPAFEDARIAMVASATGERIARLTTRFKLVGEEQETIVSSGDTFWFGPKFENGWSNVATSGSSAYTTTEVKWDTEPLVAAAAPLRAPREWFETQEPPGPMPLTITAEGRVFGHIASWDTCHTGLADVCTRPPRSQSGYSYFHVGELETKDGSELAVGKLMFSGKHAPLSMSRKAAAQHYDDNTHVGAYVRAMDGQHGIWVAGVLRTGLTDEDIAEIKANPPSGDWRPVNGSLELIAALAVPVPGFPIPRAQAAIVASGDEMHLSALLVSSGEMIPRENVVSALVAAGCMTEVEGMNMEKSSPGLSADVLIASVDEDPVQALCALVFVE